MKQFSSVDSKYGAPMGRRNYCDDDQAKCNLFRVRMVDGDYDDGGAYWGGPPSQPLYCVQDHDGQVQLFYRADTREEAKEEALNDYPNLKFYR